MSYLNFPQWEVPGGFCRLRTGWNVVNKTGVMELWRKGKKRAEAEARVSDGLRNASSWWRRTLGARPAKKLRFCSDGGFAWRPRLPRLRDRALDMG